MSKWALLIGLGPVAAYCVWRVFEAHRAAKFFASLAESPFARKCKRRRAYGPTPCLCCPGECEG